MNSFDATIDSSDIGKKRSALATWPHMPGKRPMVSILLITYNHGQYIAQALDSVLMQKTEYAFEINVIDDCSTDRTQEIVMQYVREYPNIVKPYFNAKNIGSKVTQKNFYRGFKTMTGSYLAILEGDDYWTSPFKIQKQVDFLEANPEFSMCAHNTVKVYEDGSHEPHRFLYWGPRTDGTVEDVIYLRRFYHTTGVIYRNVFKGIPPRQFRNKWSCDIFVMIAHAQFGKVRHLDEDMAVYRAHAGGRFSNMSMLDGWKFNIDGLRRYNSWLRYRYLKSFSGSIASYCKMMLTKAGNGEVAPLSSVDQIKYGYLRLLYAAVHFVLDFPDRVRRTASRQRTALGAIALRQQIAVGAMALRRQTALGAMASRQHTTLKYQAHHQSDKVEQMAMWEPLAREIATRWRFTQLHLLGLFAAKFVARPSTLKILAFNSELITCGEAFNVQPDGRSGLWMKLNGDADATTAIIFAGSRLTTVVDGAVVTAGVPIKLIAKAGLKPVWLEVPSPDGAENSEPIFIDVKRATLR
jgi:glycosyltransferase involved in cell wall biosynthesis